MHRRNFLAYAGATLGTGSGGCFSDDQQTDDDADENEVICETGDAGAPIDVQEFPGVDTPPHSIEEQDHEDDDWNDRYLGECMDTEPSLPFEQFDVSGFDVADEARIANDATHWVQIATNADEEARFWEGGARSNQDVHYRTESMILVQTNIHSGDYGHEWKRVERMDGGCHLHGYISRPKRPSTDATNLASAVAVEHGDEPIDEIIVSMTWNLETRYHFTAENGPVYLWDDTET